MKCIIHYLRKKFPDLQIPNPSNRFTLTPHFTVPTLIFWREKKRLHKQCVRYSKRKNGRKKYTPTVNIDSTHELHICIPALSEGTEGRSIEAPGANGNSEIPLPNECGEQALAHTISPCSWWVILEKHPPISPARLTQPTPPAGEREIQPGESFTSPFAVGCFWSTHVCDESFCIWWHVCQCEMVQEICHATSCCIYFMSHKNSKRRRLTS